MNLQQYIWLGAAAAAVLVLVFWLARRRKASQKAKRDLEKIDRKLKEDALDRALSNQRVTRKGVTNQTQAPAEVHYTSRAAQETGNILRVTEQAESVTKEYLFQRTEMVFLGEEYGRAAVFCSGTGNKVYCELFPYQNSVCVRAAAEGTSRLLRGKQAVPLTSKAVRLRSGDRIETKAGLFLIELF